MSTVWDQSTWDAMVANVRKTAPGWDQHTVDAEAAGVDWFLPSPTYGSVQVVEGYYIAVTVAHKLRSDTIDLSDAAPVVVDIWGLRWDAPPRKPTLDLPTIAVDAVIGAAVDGHVHKRRSDGSYVTGFGETFTETALVVARAIGSQSYRRFKWTPARDQYLADLWKAGYTAGQIGDRLNYLPAGKVRARKQVIAEQYGLQPGRTGRPRKETK